ncbi:MAG: hypothetical protein QOD39_5011 [Mycobacterium sp.]|nr:hypothetical protein [Mycobacterium sp.]
MAASPSTEAEAIRQQEPVRTALEQASLRPVESRGKGSRRNALWLVGLGGAILIVGTFYLVTAREGLIPGLSADSPARKLALGALAIAVVFAVERGIERSLAAGVHNAASRYHLRQAARLAAVVLAVIVAVSMLFSDWYTALASVGVVSLILGLALQAPLTSFFGWIYILIRAPYRVGDRIKIGDATGDVINVSYLDTTLWEFRGPYLSTDHPSGRVIKFPNSQVLQTTVYNYSWPLFPFIWNEIVFQIAYDSDLEHVAKVMQEVAEEEIGDEMLERVRVFRELLAETPVDELTVQDAPVVVFRASTNTWIEAVLRYVVHPKETGRVRSRLIRKLLPRLNAEPDRVLFPKGNAR